MSVEGLQPRSFSAAQIPAPNEELTELHIPGTTLVLANNVRFTPETRKEEPIIFTVG
jgi:hypothetical protein